MLLHSLPVRNSSRISLGIYRSPVRRVTTMGSSPKNAAGLDPTESKALVGRSLQPHEENIIKSIKEMYTCKPTDTTFSVYAQNATFHDPVGIANGRDSISAQFVALTKLFPRADITKFRVLENPSNVAASTILIDQDVAYFRKENGSSPTKTLNSLLTLETNDKHEVTRHTEEWNHAKTATSEDGFLGMLNEHRKKATASLTEMFMRK